MIRHSWHQCALAAGSALSLLLGQFSFAQETPRPKIIQLIADVAVATEEPQSTTKDEYWLGIGLEGELPQLAKEQLGLEYGLIVADVAADSPAKKAELKRFDILIKAADTALKEPPDLIRVVDASQGKEMKLELYRGGKPLTIQLTPAKRPTTEARTIRARLPGGKFDEEIKGLEKALESLKGKAGEEALGLFFARPGVMTPPRVEVLKRHELPKNMTIDINKEGDKPAKIRVKKDDQQWEVSEDKLGELPPDVRTQVQQFLSRPLRVSAEMKGPAIAAKRFSARPDGSFEADGVVELNIPALGANPRFDWRSSERGEAAGNLEAKLDAVLKKIEQLSKEVADLRASKR